MIQPLDIRVAFNAIPDLGARVSQEMAATQYRQVQETKDSRSENLNRPTKVVETASTYAPGFRNIATNDDPTARAAEVLERARRRFREGGERRDSADQPLTYGPEGLRGQSGPRRQSAMLEAAGEHLDRTA
ncbi:MAG: hypothetical protein NXI24_18680 [bacterium]|nr:hypothetical protein [bacterium]